MGEAVVKVALFFAVCLAAGLVHGATRASDAPGIVRHALREFLKLAGGIAILCAGFWLLLEVVQG